MTRFVFSYFTTQSEPDGEQVRLARSSGNDPLHWEALNSGRPVLTWTGGRGGVRDPFLLRAAGLPGERSSFYLLGTDMRAHGHDTAEFWAEDQRHGSRGIVVWESADLVSWSEPRLVEVAPETAGNAWAPEAVFDPEAGEYLVFWASMLYPAGGVRGDSFNRMLAATTRDFRTFSPAFVWSDPGHSVIDATVVRDGEWWYRFVKDERSPASDTPAAKFITVERSRDLRSLDWELVHEGVGAGTSAAPGLVHGEGPIVVQDDDRAVLLIDEFGLRRYVPFVAESLDAADWVPAADFTMPPGASHGSILAITEEEWARLGTARLGTARIGTAVGSAGAPPLADDAFAVPYRDPEFDGPTDPILVRDDERGEWRLFYTQRRATLDLPGAEWVHGSRIGTATSRDGGRTWTYGGSLSGLAENDVEGPQTHWAPSVVRVDGIWLMHLTVVEGIHRDWSGVAALHQYESDDLVTWTWTGRLALASDRVIDSAVARTPDGRYRLWYKDERQESTTFVAVSDSPRDASSWRIEGCAVGGRAHEGPVVFELGGSWWLLTDEWRGLAVHRSADGIGGWTRQEHREGLVAAAAPAHHADVVALADDADGQRAGLVYFRHPRSVEGDPESEPGRRSVVAFGTLRVVDGVLVCSLDAR